MQLGGNWTTDSTLMMTSLFADLRMTGNWATLTEDVKNTTGNLNSWPLPGGSVIKIFGAVVAARMRKYRVLLYRMTKYRSVVPK